jgi:hypothetical protein
MKHSLNWSLESNTAATCQFGELTPEHDPQKWNHFCDQIMLKLLIWRMFSSIK